VVEVEIEFDDWFIAESELALESADPPPQAFRDIKCIVKIIRVKDFL
tara:strand:+ start:133 stop:273 length:141 start_codon:yes stop_codon:yes gene_type:complete